VVDGAGQPLTISGSGDRLRNVIVWMDHRAIAEARRVNETRDDVLRYVGGSISPEMEIPKLLWLKRNLPATYRAAGHFFDLADYLSFRATGSTRARCARWPASGTISPRAKLDDSYFERVGLGDLRGPLRKNRQRDRRARHAARRWLNGIGRPRFRPA